MTVFTKTAVDVFAPEDSGGAARPVINQDAQVWGSEVERGIEAAATGLVQKATWSTATDGLEGINGSRDGQAGRVTNDPGTHFDAALGAIVQNSGEYSWNAAIGGWTRVGDLQASKEEVDEIAAKATELEGNILAPNRDQITPYRDAIYDENEVVAQGVGHDGGPRARSIEVAVATSRDEISPIIPVVTGLGDRPVLGVTADGAAFFSDLAIRSSTYLPPETLRGSHDCFNVRPFGKSQAVVATFQDGDGYTYDAMQIRSAVTTTAVALEKGYIDEHVVIGQSWAGDGEGNANTLIYTENPYPHHLLQIGNYASDFGDSEDVYYGLDRDLQPFAQDTAYGQNPLSLALQSLIRFDRDAGRRSPPRIGYTSWEGDQPLTNFFPATSGHWIHENAIHALQRSKELCAPYLRPLRLASVTLIQGQNGPVPYSATFTDWIEDVLPLYASAIGQTVVPPFLFFQTNYASNDATADAVQLDQVAVARAKTSPAVSLIGPTGQYPLWDTIHPNALGRMMLGDTHADVLDYVVRQGVAWNPLWPVAGGVTRSTNVITIPLVLPPGSSELAFDDDWVQSVTTRGFKFSQTGGNSPIIQSVEISGSNIIVTLDVAPTGTSKKISYARDNDTGTTGWSTGRGQVYARTNKLSAWRRQGFNVPEFIRHYCVSFEESFA